MKFSKKLQNDTIPTWSFSFGDVRCSHKFFGYTSKCRSAKCKQSPLSSGLCLHNLCRYSTSGALHYVSCAHFHLRCDNYRIYWGLCLIIDYCVHSHLFHFICHIGDVDLVWFRSRWGYEQCLFLNCRQVPKTLQAVPRVPRGRYHYGWGVWKIPQGKYETATLLRDV